MKKRILLSAYACEPGKGSEPGVGWNIAHQMATDNQVWVLTRANNRKEIELSLTQFPSPNLNFIYFDLPFWIRLWKRGNRGIQLYYYLWQIGIYFVAKKMHKGIQFDLVHHLTFGKYWTPSFLSFLPVPFLWGPVGGGESAPKPFWVNFGFRGLTVEFIRETARFCSEFDPFLRYTARKSSIALSKTPETADRLRKLGATEVQLFGESAISPTEYEWLSQTDQNISDSTSFKIISIGNLLHLKGFSLGLKGFAMALETLGIGAKGNIEYWIVGQGPEFSRLHNLCSNLRIAHLVKFFGKMPREKTLRILQKCQVLLHPSLHDSGGWVCLEAMAAGKPVICLDLGGPATQVTENTGTKIFPGNPSQVIQDISIAICQLMDNSELRNEKGEAGKRLVTSKYLWPYKKEFLNKLYNQILLKIV